MLDYYGGVWGVLADGRVARCALRDVEALRLKGWVAAFDDAVAELS